MYPVSLQGARVLLRELVQDDLSPIAEYAADPNVMRYVTFGRTFSVEEEQQWLSNMMEAARAPQRVDYTLAIELDGTLAGTGHLGIESSEHARGFLGYSLRRSFWGRGIATEAARELLNFGFSQLHLHRIYASVHPKNNGSIRVLEKSGLEYEGCLRGMYRATDGWRDSLIYGLVREA